MQKSNPFHVMRPRRFCLRFCFMSYRLCRLLRTSLFPFAVLPMPLPEATKPLRRLNDFSA
jgi:hypothetical protein